MWSTNDTIEDLSGLPAGYYRVTVDDSDTLTSPVSEEITLSEPRRLLLSVSAYQYPNEYNVSLYGACNGSISLNATEGVTPYTWLWSDGNTSQNRASLCAEIYTITVTDANGCIDKNSNVLLTQPDRSDWQMAGNFGTDPNVHFIGTSDSTDVVFKSDNNEAMLKKNNSQLKMYHMKYLIILLLASIPFTSNAQWQWAKKFGGSDMDGGGARIIDANNNMCLYVSFNYNFFSQTDTLWSSGNDDLFIAKLNSNTSSSSTPIPTPANATSRYPRFFK